MQPIVKHKDPTTCPRSPASVGDHKISLLHPSPALHRSDPPHPPYLQSTDEAGAPLGYQFWGTTSMAMYRSTAPILSLSTTPRPRPCPCKREHHPWVKMGRETKVVWAFIFCCFSQSLLLPPPPCLPQSISRARRPNQGSFLIFRLKMKDIISRTALL